MSQPTLLGLSGSLRQSATNRKLLREAARLFDPASFVEADLNLPLYDGDLEEGEGIPAAVKTLADQIAQADAVIISTPEYNKGPSGVLKNALDWVRNKNVHLPGLACLCRMGRRPNLLTPCTTYGMVPGLKTGRQG